ncbi:MAG: 16S rRNA (guanine(527)-N(7))-methyltransferase RsmG [Jannaschia sp.]
MSETSNVSRETEETLRRYAALLLKWSPRINLVSESSERDIWNRHIEDSAHIARYADGAGSWVDLGSGGGLPGVVVAILNPAVRTVLVESDKRKCEFLRAVRRELDLRYDVLAGRIETIPPCRADVFSARALAPLDRLLRLVERHGHADTTYLFPKGSSWEAEHVAASREWSYDLTVLEGTGSGGKLLKLSGLARKNDVS